MITLCCKCERKAKAQSGKWRDIPETAYTLMMEGSLDPNRPHEGISHGYCTSCLAEAMEEIECMDNQESEAS